MVKESNEGSGFVERADVNADGDRLQRFEGVALNRTKSELYAANFRYGTLEVFDSTYGPPTTPAAQPLRNARSRSVVGPSDPLPQCRGEGRWCTWEG